MGGEGASWVAAVFVGDGIWGWMRGAVWRSSWAYFFVGIWGGCDVYGMSDGSVSR